MYRSRERLKLLCGEWVDRREQSTWGSVRHCIV